MKNLIKYGNHALLIIAGLATCLMRVITYVHIGPLYNSYQRDVSRITGYVRTLNEQAWEYSLLPIIIGLFLIASGVLGIIKEMKT
jgi:hypothetical protein